MPTVVTATTAPARATDYKIHFVPRVWGWDSEPTLEPLWIESNLGVNN
jgi:hypothetical protein